MRDDVGSQFVAGLRKSRCYPCEFRSLCHWLRGMSARRDLVVRVGAARAVPPPDADGVVPLAPGVDVAHVLERATAEHARQRPAFRARAGIARSRPCEPSPGEDGVKGGAAASRSEGTLDDAADRWLGTVGRVGTRQVTPPAQWFVERAGLVPHALPRYEVEHFW